MTIDMLCYDHEDDTRAVPDVTELVTVGHLWEYAEYHSDDSGYYGYVKIITEENPNTHVSPASKIRRHRELVTRDQAAEIIAAKDEEIERLKDDSRITFDKYLDAHNENVTLKAKLAQYEAQEPVAWMHPEARWTDVSKQEVAVHCKVGTYPLPLYDAPVSDSMKAECDRYKEALGLCQRTLAMIIDPKSIVSTTSIIAFASATEAEAKARTALKGESNDKG